MFASILKELRKSAKYTQDQVAESLSVPVRTYGSWERGERQPDFETLSKIADLYNVTADYLLGRTPVPIIITKEAPPAEPPQGMKRMVLDFGNSTTDIADKEPDPFEQRVAAILEKELKKRGL